MKAVILCAGEGLRMRPLTLNTPKPLLEIRGRPILEYIFENLPENVDEVVIVISYLGEKIKKYFGNEFSGRKIVYAEQGGVRGTFGALLSAKPYLGEEKFLLLFGDDILDKASITKCLRHELAVLVKAVPDPRRFGVVVTDSKGKILDFMEKPENPPSNLANTGVKVLDQRVFDYWPHKNSNGEFYLVDAVARLAKDYPVFVEHARVWHSFASPEDLRRIDENFKTLTNK